jgi:polyisoprenoid-binding protein YceI
MMVTRYQFEPKHSQFTVQAFATGLLSFMGHNPTIAIRDFDGVVTFEDEQIAKMPLELRVRAGSLEVTDAVKSSDRSEIEGRMRSDVLETASFPEIEYRATAAKTERIGNGHYRVALDGKLVLRGLSHPHRSQVELTIFKDGIRLKGGTGLGMSDYGIQPVTALGGTIRLKDEVMLSFDLGARPVAS